MLSFVEEAHVYLWIAGIAQSVVVALPLAIGFALLGRRPPPLASFKAWVLVNACLLVFGCLGHWVWLSITWHKLYVSADRLVDFFPFIPFGQWALNQNLGEEHGRLLNGTSLWELRLIWSAIALPVWVLSLASVLLLRKSNPSSVPVQPVLPS